MQQSEILRRADDCGNGGGADSYTGLRIASVFIVMATSMFGALFPVVSRKTGWLHVRIPTAVFQVAKYFGSGVIISTAFIHLLDPAISSLSSPCLPSSWQEYPYALAICLVSIFMIFLIEIIAFRWGTAVLAKIGMVHDPHGHGLPNGGHAAHGPEHRRPSKETPRDAKDADSVKEEDREDLEGLPQLEKGEPSSPVAQILGIAILEFGVLLHSVFVGLTLAVNANFKILFVVIIFHQMFEGLGVGSRLAYMELPPAYSYVPFLGAGLYGITTPVGIAAGLGVRASYNPHGTTADIVGGILDAFSSGILIYTGLVELMAHEFIFSKEMTEASNRHLAFALACMILGAGLMSLLGKWA
ncbi:ZIP-like iron-zinc transporter [Laetiporus sulphureus 93-53]|uniref:ZIP-like iron-zinc transporter n=1 Tax=Laetiporus sulphureus 93-53 TaxID=1314785 RepID=A0A165H6C2_9APHY|nr:ZIP-like iron-zinc transporter [Laetiporus sulphureus 93-53]KZT11302.1 ZIP-like iron-zinc transporter [Laetiporus sulphureus 93-53]